MSGRVLVLEPLYDFELIEQILGPAGVTVEMASPPATGDDVVALLLGPDQPIGRSDLDRLPALRAVATCSVGYDHLDLESAAERGVTVANVPDYCIEEVADSTIALVLDLLRGITVLDRSVREGRWDDHAAGRLWRIGGTPLGLVGFGRIGQAVGKRALALGMEVWANDAVLSDEQIADAGARPASLDELLASCRAISLHAPLTPETEALIGKRELDLLPEGAVLVNTARARLVDMAAVEAALRSGRLQAAAFDVLPVEPPPEPPSVPNLVVTPHAAWYSEEADAAAQRRPAEAVLDVLQGREPRDRIPAP